MNSANDFAKKSRNEFVSYFNHRYRVVGYTLDELGNARVYRVDMLEGADDLPNGGKPGKKNAVTEFTLKSRKKMIDIIQRCTVKWESMLTLTYPLEFPSSGKIVKKDLNRVLTLIRKMRGDVIYFWWFEFQKRGAPHCHVLFDFVPNKDEIKSVIKSWVKGFSFYAYSRMSDGAITSCLNEALKFNGHIKFWQRIRKPGGGARYATKYATKMRQKVVPSQFADVGRFWGNSRSLPTAKVVEWVDATSSGLIETSKNAGVDFVARCAIIPANIYGLRKDIKP